MRLDKYLADMGIGSRSFVKEIIKKGKVTVNGELIKSASVSVLESDTVFVNGEQVKYQTHEYYMLNKPADVISATSDDNQKTVMDLFPKERRRDLFPIGRLDKDTVGLLIITNDGALAHELLSPKKHVDKVYYVKTEGLITEEDIAAFKNGLILKNEEKTMPAKLEIISPGEISEAYVTIKEGKYHQVKRMFAACGKKVIYLKRISMGGLLLDQTLKEGEWRELLAEELAILKR
ncbi:MAG: rRNA pseudouridine synthase [Lachnospiraceae bacterium]|nr:rRNA pseudouridine synthase [Lachnospiraceae bacterium]